MGLTQIGFSQADISKLKIENIKNLYTIPQTDHYFIEKPREKTGELQDTCFSYELLHDLRAMLSEKGNPETARAMQRNNKNVGKKGVAVFRFYSSGFGSTHFSMSKVSPFSLKLTLTNIESAPLNGNMLSSAKSFGK